MIFPPQLIGTTREHYLVLFGAAGSIALVSGFIGSWIGAYLGARRAVRTAQLSAPDSASLSSVQFAQLAQALDAVAVEVERISEGQRFATRVLSERSALPPRTVTGGGSDREDSPPASSRLPPSAPPCESRPVLATRRPGRLVQAGWRPS